MHTLKSYLSLASLSLLAIYLVLATSWHSTFREHVRAVRTMAGIYTEYSPSLASTVAFVRYNSERLDRKASIERYAPFFHTIHHSMPRRHEGQDVTYYTDEMTLTDDNYTRSPTTYHVVADLMQRILDDHADITGILYYHFDAWIDPQGFANMNYTKIWWPVWNRPPDDNRYYNGPAFGCYNFDQDRKDAASEWPYTWWFFREDAYGDTMEAHNDVARNTHFGLEEEEFCTGWSDMYYIPRRFFGDFISLADRYNHRAAFHESVVPTIISLIDRLHKTDPDVGVIEFMTDCWGDCCSSNPSILDIEQYRCGHRLDWLDPEVTHAVLSKLENQKAALESHW